MCTDNCAGKMLMIIILLILGGYALIGEVKGAYAASLYLEVPEEGETYTGVGVIQGWGVDLDGPVVVSIDDGEPLEIAVGDTRKDVVAQFGDGGAGFSMSFNYGNLTPGNHSITVTSGGLTQEVWFISDAFPAPFVSIPELQRATVELGFQGLTLHEAWFPEVGYVDLELAWRGSRQGFEIISITPKPQPQEPPSPPPCGFSSPGPC